MSNNVSADTTTCKYSLSNMTRKVVQFNNDGTVQFASGAASMTTAKTDYNLIMEVGDLDGASPSNLKNYLKFSVEGDKFSLLSANYSIYNYTVNNFQGGIDALKKCPTLAILYADKGSDKFVIANISAITNGSNIQNLVSVYEKNGIESSTFKKILCYYGNPDEAPYYATIRLEINGTNGNANSFLLDVNKSKTSTFVADNSYALTAYSAADYRVTDGSGTRYRCNNVAYFNVVDDYKLKPVSIKTNNMTRQLSLSHAYHIPGTLYFSEINLYDANTNSGASGMTVIPGTPGYCSLHPEAQVCKAIYASTSTGVFKFCKDVGVLKTLRTVSVLIMIAKILVPILIIVLGSINYGKAALADNQDAAEKTTQALIKKIIIGVLIFLIPTIVNSLISLSQSGKDKSDATGEFGNCALCFAGDKQCNVIINNIEKQK
jgi:hypothetical protein